MAVYVTSIYPYQLMTCSLLLQTSKLQARTRCRYVFNNDYLCLHPTITNACHVTHVYGRRVGAVYIVAPFWYEDSQNSIPYSTIILFMYTPFNTYIASKQFRAHEIQMHIKDRIDRVPTPPFACPP